MIVGPQFQDPSALSDFTMATGRPEPRPPQHQTSIKPGGDFSGPMRVTISHEYFVEGVVLIFEGQSTDEISHEEALNWFKIHGSKNETAVNEAINCAVNFGKADIWIKDPIRIFPVKDPIEPRL